MLAVDQSAGTQSLPPILRKAWRHNWHYCLETKLGQQFVFGEISSVDGKWIHLEPLDEAYTTIPPFDVPLTNPCRVGDGGLDIRLEAIAWVAAGIP